jgi:hypothetical protein
MAQFNRQRTGLDIVKSVCGQLGLPVPTAVASNPADKLAQQMWWLLSEAGERLVKPMHGYRWQVLKRTWTLNTVPGQTQYPLPVDWDSFIDQTANSKSLLMPLAGPVGDATWAYLAASTMGPTIWLTYRTRRGMFEIMSSPATAQEVHIDYTSRAWVQAAGGAYADQLQQDDDVCLYDAELIKAALKLAFLQAKGFDTTVAQNDFDLALELAINADSDAPIISAAAYENDGLISGDTLSFAGPAGVAGAAGAAGPAGPAGVAGAPGVPSTEYVNSETPPASADLGDRWFVPSTGKLFTYVFDGTSNQWVEL